MKRAASVGSVVSCRSHRSDSSEKLLLLLLLLSHLSQKLLMNKVILVISIQSWGERMELVGLRLNKVKTKGLGWAAE